jgi:hypothetical protein
MKRHGSSSRRSCHVFDLLIGLQFELRTVRLSIDRLLDIPGSQPGSCVFDQIRFFKDATIPAILLAIRNYIGYFVNRGLEIFKC